MNEEIDFIKTSDFTLASTLLCLSNDIDGIDRENPKRVVFYFKKTSHIEDLITKYFSGQVLVNPLEYAHAQRELRAQIHTEV